MRGFSIAIALLAACTKSAAPVSGAAAPVAPAPTAGSAAPLVHKTYEIRDEQAEGVTHLTKVAVDVPGSWHERFDDDRKSPAFETSPDKTIAVVDVLESPGRSNSARIDYDVAHLFYDAKSPQRVAKSGGRLWVVDRRASGAVHAAMLIPGPTEMIGGMAAERGYIGLCETRLAPSDAVQIGELAHICDTMQLLASEDRAAPGAGSGAPLSPPPRGGARPHDIHITPKKRTIKDVVQPVHLEKQPEKE